MVSGVWREKEEERERVRLVAEKRRKLELAQATGKEAGQARVGCRLSVVSVASQWYVMWRCF